MGGSRGYVREEGVCEAGGGMGVRKGYGREEGEWEGGVWDRGYESERERERERRGYGRQGYGEKKRSPSSKMAARG